MNHMLFSINLLTKEKSKYRIIFGILAIVFSISWIFINLGENDEIKIFDWFYFAIFLTLGIGHVIEGAGISLVEIFGAKAYIQVDAEKIRIKINPFVKEKTVAWNEILELEYKSARYKITKVDNSNIILDLPTENYRQVQGIKEIIKSFAKYLHHN
jgi:hypothetical protein